MDMVLLKSRIGTYGPITDTVRIESEDGHTRFERRRFFWNFDNDLKCPMPKEIWERLEHQWLDRSANLKYKDAFLEL